MNSKKIIIILLCIIFALALAAGVYAAVSYGSQDDPLIAKSYLDEVLRPEIEAEMNKEIDAAIAEIESPDNGADFVPLRLSAGDKLSCALGCEILHRSGTIVAGGAFTDTTSGIETAAGTDLKANHLYMSLEESQLTAKTDVTIMIKGSYSLN